MSISEKQKLINSFNKSAKELLLLCTKLSEGYDELNEEQKNRQLFRIRNIQHIIYDIAMMRDCMVDTYNIEWNEYVKKFKSELDKQTKKPALENTEKE